MIVLVSDSSRMMEPQEIVKKVEAALPGAEVSVKDLTGTLDHFRVTVIALQFEGIRFDAGDRLGYLEANLHFALKRPELKRGVLRMLEKYSP